MRFFFGKLFKISYLIYSKKIFLHNDIFKTKKRKKFDISEILKILKKEIFELHNITIRYFKTHFLFHYKALNIFFILKC